MGRLHSLLLLVKKGRVRFVIETDHHPLSPGRLLMVPQGRMWSLQHPSSAIHLGILGLDLKQLRRQTTSTLPSALIQYWEVGIQTLELEKKELYWLFKLFQILEAKIIPTISSPSHEPILRYGLYMLLSELDRLVQRNNNLSHIMHTAGQFLVLRFMDLLTRHYRSEHQVGFYAGLLHVTPDHLSKVIKKHTGRTAKDHIKQLLMEEAKILVQSKKSIKEIAQLLGFQTPYAFSKFFKGNASLAPNIYRKKHET